MGRVALLDLVAQIVRQAETACLDGDAAMRDAAGMVYVGDVYALLLTLADRDDPPATGASDSVWPFIR